LSIEGGAFICYRHDYVTSNVKEWDKHCYETGHEEIVVQHCLICGNIKEGVIKRPERMVERLHSNKPEDENVLYLKCDKCGK